MPNSLIDSLSELFEFCNPYLTFFFVASAGRCVRPVLLHQAEKAVYLLSFEELRCWKLLAGFVRGALVALRAEHSTNR